MKTQSKWREELANSLFQKVKDDKGIIAFFIGGSVALNVADDFSDLELCIVWKENPTIKKITKIREVWQVQSFHTQEIQLDNGITQIEDSVRLQDFAIDIFHISFAYIECVFRKVLIEFDTNFNYSNFLYVIQNSIVLKGNNFHQKWQEQIANYPRQLAINSIKKRIESFFGADGILMVERKNWTLFYNLITAYQKLIFLTLLSINKMYFPTYKRIFDSLEKMKVKPKGIKKFYQEFQQMRPKEAWHKLIKIKQETLEIVNQKYPEIETNHLLKKMKWMRRKFKNPTNF